MFEVVNIVLALGPTNIGRHQAAIGVEGKLVTLREALAQRAASINSQVDTVDVSGSGRQQEDYTRGNLRLGAVASAGALLPLEHMKQWSELFRRREAKIKAREIFRPWFLTIQSLVAIMSTTFSG